MSKTTGNKAENAILDAADKRILRVLQTDASLTHAQIGERVNMSASSVRRRIEALKKNGVIRSIVAVVDGEAARAAVTIVVTVTFERETKEAYDEFELRMAKQDIVTQCYFVAGVVDAVLIVTAPTTADYWEWAERELRSHPLVRRFESMFTSSTAKCSVQVPI